MGRFFFPYRDRNTPSQRRRKANRSSNLNSLTSCAFVVTKPFTSRGAASMLRIMGLRVEAFSSVPRLRAGLFCDLPPGEFCPLRIPPFGMAAVSPRDKSRKDGALPPVTSEKASTLSPIGGGHLMPPSLPGEVYALGFVTILCWCEMPPVFECPLGS
jgi:hypothetical protein